MSNEPIAWLGTTDAFPDIEQALTEPDGLLAAGGDLSSERLIAAYSRGIFPWFSDGQPILWWSPNPRCVLYPADYHVSRRLRKSLRNSSLTISFNCAFDRVIRACAEDRSSQQGTWITDDMIAAYEHLHAEGWAHSVEVWDKYRLIGGMYGLAIGKTFFGESMFSRATNASKLAMLALCQQLLAGNFVLLDCQVESQHLLTLGATTIPRAEFAKSLRTACATQEQSDHWPKKTLPIRDLLPD